MRSDEREARCAGKDGICDESVLNRKPYRSTHSHQHVPSLDENTSNPGNNDQTLLLVQTTTTTTAALVECLALS